MNTPRITITMGVHNAAMWLPVVLRSAVEQTYRPLEIIVFDNASTDTTADIVRQFPMVRLICHASNIGVWAAQELMISQISTEYIFPLTDVVLDPLYVARIVHAMEGDRTIGSAQGKLYQMTWRDGQPNLSSTIDALGFLVGHSRRVTILGHGQQDAAKWNVQCNIFAVEGAAPIFRTEAIHDCRIEGRFTDPDFRVGALGYGDDLDAGWRMTLFGWNQVMVPSAIGWHARSTTTATAETVSEHVGRIATRRKIPITKRRLDWSNVRFTIIKNDYIVNILRDGVKIILREIIVQAYSLLIEPGVLKEWWRFFTMMPRMFRRRRQVMARARRSAAAMHRYFIN